MRTTDRPRPTPPADSRRCEHPAPDPDVEDDRPVGHADGEPVPEEAGYGYGV